MMKFKNQIFSLENRALILLIFFLISPISAGLGPNGQDLKDYATESNQDQTRTINQRTVLGAEPAPYHNRDQRFSNLYTQNSRPSTQSSMQPNTFSEQTREQFDDIDREDNIQPPTWATPEDLPSSQTRESRSQYSVVVPPPLDPEIDGFDEFNHSLGSTQQFDQSFPTQESEFPEGKPILQLPPLLPPNEQLETIFPEQPDESLMQREDRYLEPKKGLTKEKTDQFFEGPNTEKHFRPDSRGGLSPEIYDVVDKDNEPVPQPGEPFGEGDLLSPATENYYQPTIPQIADAWHGKPEFEPFSDTKKVRPEPQPVTDQPQQTINHQDDNPRDVEVEQTRPQTEQFILEQPQNQKASPEYAPPKLHTPEASLQQQNAGPGTQWQTDASAQQDAHREDQESIKATNIAPKQTDQINPQSPVFLKEKESSSATIEPIKQKSSYAIETQTEDFKEQIPTITKANDHQPDVATQTPLVPSIPATQKSYPVLNPQRANTQKVTLPAAAKTNENINTITINVGQQAPQMGQVPGFGNMPSFVYSPFFNPLQFMPYSGYPAIAWPYPSFPGSTQQGQSGPIMQYPGGSTPTVQQLPTSQNTQPIPATNTIAQPSPLTTTATSGQPSALTSIGSSLGVSGLSTERTSLPAIKALRTKLEQASLQTLLGSDIKNFNSRLDEFQTIVELIILREYDLFTMALSDPEVIKTEMTEFIELVTIMVEGGRSASDQDQLRPFSLKTYDKDSVIVLSRFARLLQYLIEGGGFILTMQHLGLLDKFLSSCKIIMFPPFTSMCIADPLDGDRSFRPSYDKFIGKLNALATSLNSNDIREKQAVPEPLLTMLEEMDISPDLMVIQPMGFKENAPLKQYPTYAKDSFPKDKPSRDRAAATLSKDILRDILATALVKFMLAGAEIFVDKFEASTFFKSIPQPLRLMFVAAIENLFSVKVAGMTTTATQGKPQRSMRQTVLDKLDEDLEQALAVKRNATAFRNLVVKAGTSSRESKILQLLAQAETLLHIGGPGEVAYEATTAQARILSDYKSGTEILSKIFLTYYDTTFATLDSEGVQIKQVSDSTINRLFIALQDANEDSRTIIGTANPKYTAYRTQLMQSVQRNTVFKARLAQVSPGSNTELNSFISRP